MTCPPLSERFCDPCKEDNKQIKARTLCYECHTLLCEPCSNYHQRLKISKDHNLVELVQFINKSASQDDPSTSKQTSTSVNEDELASDFLETVTLTDNTVLYRGAQVAARPRSITTKPEKPTISIKADNVQLKATKCLEFRVKGPADKEEVHVRNILCVSNNVVVIDYENKVLKLFDQNGTCLSYTESKDYARGMTCISGSTFATCGSSQKVHLWSVQGNTIVSKNISYHVDQTAHGIHYNGTYYCVLHRREHAITILRRSGTQVRKIIRKKACWKVFEFGFGIHMDSDTNNIYVLCDNENGVLCMTIEGRALWFTSLSYTCGITEIQGTLCVGDYSDTCLHMINKGGNYVRKLLDKEDLGGKPRNVCYGHDGKLYVSYVPSDEKHHIITVFSDVM